MELGKIIETISSGDLVLIAVLLCSLIQITPIKINPWSWLLKWAGRAINGEVMQELKSQKADIAGVHKEIDEMRKCTARKRADDARNRILRFDDELRRHIKHSKEFWEQAIEDCDFYTEFCSKNKKYINGKADSAIKNIKTTYNTVKAEDDFI